MKVNQLFVAAFALGASFQAHASAIVFSNLQGNGLMCGCATGGGPTVGTWPGDPTEQFTAGDAFSVSPASSFTLDRVELAAALISGSVNALDVFLYSDGNNQPDKLLESFRIDNQMGPFGKDHPLVIADSVSHPRLEANTQYWLLTNTADPNTWAGWYANITEDIGPVGTRVNDGPFCCVRDDSRSAFAVLGTPIEATPEPSTACMLGIGVLLLLAGTVGRSRGVDTKPVRRHDGQVRALNLVVFWRGRWLP
jgi:hypothetical protein